VLVIFLFLSSVFSPQKIECYFKPVFNMAIRKKNLPVDESLGLSFFSLLLILKY